MSAWRDPFTRNRANSTGATHFGSTSHLTDLLTNSIIRRAALMHTLHTRRN